MLTMGNGLLVSVYKDKPTGDVTIGISHETGGKLATYYIPADAVKYVAEEMLGGPMNNIAVICRTVRWIYTAHRSQTVRRSVARIFIHVIWNYVLDGSVDAMKMTRDETAEATRLTTIVAADVKEVTS